MVLEDPFARSAIWSRNLAVFALIVAVIGILLARKGLDPKLALAIEGGALTIAGLSLLSAVLAMGVIWHTGFRGISLAVGGLTLSGLLFAYPAYIAVQARTMPALTDVSTDLSDPPTFLTTRTALAARDGTTPPAPREQQQALQTKLFPDFGPLSYEVEAADAVKSIHKIIKRHKWTIVDEEAPVNFQTGHIDVVVKTAVMGFPADLTFRTRELGSRTQIDIRSVSRAGWQENPGSNANRVQTLMSELDAELSGG